MKFFSIKIVCFKINYKIFVQTHLKLYKYNIILNLKLIKKEKKIKFFKFIKLNF